MYKTLVYTLFNGNIQGPTHRKQQKITKGDHIVRIACVPYLIHSRSYDRG